MTSMMGLATVKAVTSGDTIQLVGKATNGPPPEMTITLGSIQSPRLARAAGQSDEPFAWKAREFLRQLCIGKQVVFKVIQNVPTINRTFGDVELDGTNLSISIVRNGWASVKESREGFNSAVYQTLTELNAEAKTNQVGMYSIDPLITASAIRTIKWSPTVTDVEDVYNKFKGQSIRVVIEYIRDGASMRVLYLDEMMSISVSLTGVVCPRLNSPKADAEPSAAPTAAEPYAMQAKHFAELRLLNREVDLVLDGIDRSGGLLVTVKHPKGNISAEILRSGLGKVADYSLVLLSREIATSLRQAENEAKVGKKFVWADYEPEASSHKVVHARVIEVLSSDALVVAEVKDASSADLLSSLGEEMKIFLSSVRAPKAGLVRGGLVVSPEEPWAREGKEFLRSKLIGTNVTVVVEYSRTIVREDGAGDAMARLFATVRHGLKGKENVAEQLVAAGLARVVRHRPGEDRSSDYDALMRAEAEAAVALKGVHGSSQPNAPPRINDVSTDGKKAKQLLPSLQRTRVHKAIVEHVFTGSRFKVLLPHENCAIQLSLSQVRAPTASKTAPGAAPAEPKESDICAEYSRRFSRVTLLQRQVEIEIDDVDKNGIGLGKLILPVAAVAVQGQAAKKVSTSSKGVSYAQVLLQNGWAKLDRYHVDSTDGSELNAIESAAKLAGIGLWAYVSEEEPVQDESPKAEDPSQSVTVTVGEVEDGSTLYLQTSATQLGEVTDMMSVFTVASPPPALMPSSLRKGLQCAALYPPVGPGVDSKWYRVKVESISKADDGDYNVAVFYLDFGNRETVPLDRLAELDSAAFALPPQAARCSLAFLRTLPVANEFGRDAAEFLSSLVFGQAPLRMQTLWKDSATNESKVVLFQSDSEVSINELLVCGGLARVSQSGAKRGSYMTAGRPSQALAASLLQTLSEAEDKAHKKHLCMWAYGDPGGSDDDNDDRQRVSRK